MWIFFLQLTANIYWTNMEFSTYYVPGPIMGTWGHWRVRQRSEEKQAQEKTILYNTLEDSECYRKKKARKVTNLGCNLKHGDQPWLVFLSG